MRPNLHQDCHKNCSLVKEVRAISETKIIAAGFIRLQKRCVLLHTSSCHSSGLWAPSREPTLPRKVTTGKSDTNMIHGGSLSARSIRSSALGCSQLKESISISIGTIPFLDPNSTEMVTARAWFCFTAISDIWHLVKMPSRLEGVQPMFPANNTEFALAECTELLLVSSSTFIGSHEE